MAAGISRSARPRGNPHNDPHLLLELAGDGRLDRQVSRVVGTGGNLVDQEPALLAVKKNSTVKTPTVPSAWAAARARLASLFRDDRARPERA